METGIIIELINTVGFPIATCVALFWMNINTLKQQRIILSELTKAVDHNTQIMRELNNQLGRL